MFSKCGDWIYFCLLVFELLCFVIFLVDGGVSLVWNSSSVASPSTIVGTSMNLYSGYRLAVALPYVCGKVIYVVLFSCLMGYGTSALNAYHIDVISLICCCYVKVIFLGCPHMSDLVWILPPSKYGVSLLRRVDLLLTCDSQWIWYEPLELVLDAFHLILGGGTIIKFAVFTKYAPSCYQ